MERRRRFLVRELLPRCDLMIAAAALPDRLSPDAAQRSPSPDSQDTRDLCPPLPLEEDGGEGPRNAFVDICVMMSISDLQKRADLIKDFIKWSGHRHQSGLLTV
jgi:hypothetical protein